ncbi:MAG: SpoIID/LytB domain-containing protein [Fidelibacterota bacterium]
MNISSNILPGSEPLIQIGIILPEDQRKSVTLSFTHPSQYEIDSNRPLTWIGKNKNKLNISIEDGDVFIRKSKSQFDPRGITVHEVPAGRGFHWEKPIDVILPGNIRIKSQNQYLLVVNEVPLEQYLACVAVSEMSGKCPPALLEAQTITARSWIMAAEEKKHGDLGLDACNDDCCQRYQGLGQMTEISIKAANDSKGIFLIHDNQICDARYSKSCGGITEGAEYVWDMEPKPYLTSVYDGPETDVNIDWDQWFDDRPNTFCSPTYANEMDLHAYLGIVDKKGSYFRWNVNFTQKEFCAFFSKIINMTVSHIDKIDSLKRGKSGRINHLYLDYQTSEGKSKTIQIKSEYEIRRMLHPSFLYSSCFMVNMDGDHIEFKGAGWGHGVGLCQIGALGMALNGYSTEDILTHYFTNSNLKKLY